MTSFLWRCCVGIGAISGNVEKANRLGDDMAGEVISSGETKTGAGRFAAGTGRYGKF